MKIEPKSYLAMLLGMLMLIVSNSIYAGSWRHLSHHVRTQLSISASGIGGLRIDFSRSADLDINPKDLSYKSGKLFAKIRDEERSFEISSSMLSEAIKVATGNSETLEVSIDLLPTFEMGSHYLYSRKKVTFVSRPLRDSALGELLLDADVAIAKFASGGGTLVEESKLLEGNSQYEALTNNWSQPPLIWPQTTIIFEPDNSQSLVELSLVPQIFFLSPSRHPVAVDEYSTSIGQLPLAPFVAEFEAENSQYRSESDEFRTAIELTAVLGILRAGCRDKTDCRHLETRASADRVEVGIDTTNQLRDYYDYFWSQIRDEARLQQWRGIRMDNFRPSTSPQSWATAFDFLLLALQEIDRSAKKNYVTKLVDSNNVAKVENPRLDSMSAKNAFRLLKAEKKLAYQNKEPLALEYLEIASKQFSNFEIPDDPLLKAAKLALDSEAYGLIEGTPFQNIIDSIDDYTGDKLPEQLLDKLMVTELGIAGANFLIARNGESLDKGEELLERMRVRRADSYFEAVAFIDRHLDLCFKSLGGCMEHSLREIESFVNRISMALHDNDHASKIYAKLSYLIGIKLYDNTMKRDRFRLLQELQLSSGGEVARYVCSLVEKFRVKEKMGEVRVCGTHRQTYLILGFCLGGVILIVVMVGRRRSASRRYLYELTGISDLNQPS